MSVSKRSKLMQWIQLSATRPVEAFDRAMTVVDVRSDRLRVEPPDYSTVSYDDAWSQLVAIDPSASADVRSEAAAVEAAVRRTMSSLDEAPMSPIHSADFALAGLCYAATRLRRPEKVLETGVAYGVTSAFILSALKENGMGTLDSIDLQPLGKGVDRFVGAFVPDSLKDRWTLHRGVSKRVLPKVLESLGDIDVFVHDSLHTYKNITFELEQVSPRLCPNAVVIVDDIDENPAFLEWSRSLPLSFSGVVKEQNKDSLLGIAVLTDLDSRSGARETK